MGRNKYFWFCLFLFCGSAADAIDWEVEPSITVAETYSDNLELAPNAVKFSDLITEVLPAITIGATGKAFDVDLEYRLQGLSYAERDEFDETLTYARAGGKAKLIGDSLFVDFSGAINHQIIDPGGRVPVSGITRSDRSEVKQFSIRPFWQSDFGSSGNINIGYRFGEIAYAERSSDDSQNSGVSATISGSPPRTQWSWVLDVKQSSIEYDSGSSIDFQRIGGELAWSFSGDTALFIGAGDQNNDFSSELAGLPKIDGGYWNVGFRGRLDRKTTYSLSVGDEYYGSSYDFSLTRDAGRLSTEIKYFEETTSAGQQRLDYESLYQILTDVTGFELPDTAPSAYVRKRFTAAATLKLPRSSLRLDVYDENREFLTATENERDGIAGAVASWTWDGLKLLDLSFVFAWQNYEQLPTEDFRLVLEAKRNLKYKMFVQLRAWRNIRSGATPDIEYTVNAVSFALGKRF